MIKENIDAINLCYADTCNLTLTYNNGGSITVSNRTNVKNVIINNFENYYFDYKNENVHVQESTQNSFLVSVHGNLVHRMGAVINGEFSQTMLFFPFNEGYFIINHVIYIKMAK